MSPLTFRRVGARGADTVTVAITGVVIAGWAGRDPDAIAHHIEELAAIGVPRPSTTPLFYRVSADRATTADRITVLGPDSSGEVEPVLVSLVDGWWIGVGSDHTDRKAEAHGVALSKQLCPKPVSPVLWPFAEVADRLDALRLSSRQAFEGDPVVYQEGTLAGLLPLPDLVRRFEALGGAFTPGMVMFGGTLGAIGGVRCGRRFETLLEDPVTGRAIDHAYDVEALPVVT